MKKVLKWFGIVFLILLGLIAIANAISGDKEEKDSSEPAKQVNDEFNNTEETNLTIEDKLYNQIEKKLDKRSYRSHNDSYIDKIKEVNITNNFLFIKLSADENLFGRNMEKFGIKSDIIKVMQTIEIPDDIEMVAFEFYYPTRDENYNYKETLVMSGWIEKEKFDINWDNVYDTDLPNIMIDVYWRPGF